MKFEHAEKMFIEHRFVIGRDLAYNSVLIVVISEFLCINLYFDGTTKNDSLALPSFYKGCYKNRQMTFIKFQNVLNP